MSVSGKPPRVRPADHGPERVKLERRLLLRSSLSLGALAMLSGCTCDACRESACTA